jgi:uncharacterized membrane protein
MAVDFRLSPIDWSFEAISLFSLIATLSMAAGSWSHLPATIPTHFGMSGAPNAFGSRQSIWLVPVLAVFIYLMLTASARFPKFVNLPFKVDRTNPEVQRIIFRMLATSKAATMLLFAYIVYGQIQSAINATNSMGLVLLPVFLAANLVPFIYYMNRLRRYKQ